MTKKEKLAAIGGAYETAKRGDGSEYVRIKEGPMEEGIKRAQFTLNEETGTFELDYSIMQDACQAIADNCETLEQLHDLDPQEAAEGYSTVYTAQQHEYLHIQNDAEIADIIKEYSLDSVGQAAAIWYENQVARAIDLVRDYIESDEV